MYVAISSASVISQQRCSNYDRRNVEHRSSHPIPCVNSDSIAHHTVNKPASVSNWSATADSDNATACGLHRCVTCQSHNRAFLAHSRGSQTRAHHGAVAKSTGTHESAFASWFDIFCGLFRGAHDTAFTF